MKQKNTMKPVTTDYICPICDLQLLCQWGNSIHIGDKNFGVTLYCPNGDPNGQKHPAEVSGHGNGRSEESMLTNAYKIILAKFCGEKLTESENEPETEVVEDVI